MSPSWLSLFAVSCISAAAAPANLRRLSPPCPAACSWAMLDDGICQPECDNFACDLDGGDCRHGEDMTREKFGECPASCPLSYIGDEWCDVDCDVEACGHDKGDCNPGCAPGCREQWQNDTYCDSACDNYECGYDKGDCKHPNLNLYAYSSCPYTCPLSWVADGYCDTECDVPECLFDGEDCSESPPEKLKCASDCDPLWMGDGLCDFECNTLDCEWDKGDCPSLQATCAQAASDCSPLWYGDGECDLECNWEECDFDGGDCKSEEKKISACEANRPDCQAPWLQDGECDPECNNADCEYDKGDCPSEVPSACKTARPDCQRDFLGDGMCDQACAAAECSWDSGDCTPLSPQCAQTASECEAAWLGDGECDPECYTKGCNYDAGDCQEPAPCSTTGSEGVGAGHQCVFPFRYRGVLYDECTATNSDFAWCSTQISSRGEHVKDQWGECSHSCATTCMTVGDGGVGPGQKCEFPFIYDGMKYDSCTSIENTVPWCATKTSDDWGYLQGHWGECAPECKGFSSAEISAKERRNSVALFIAIVVMAVFLVGLVCTVVYMGRRIKQLGVGNASRSEYSMSKVGSESNTIEDGDNTPKPSSLGS